MSPKSAAGSSQPAPGLPARKAAVAVLSAVLRDHTTLERATAELIDASLLEPRDKGFARALATESLRRFGQLDALIRQFVSKQPPPHKAGNTLEILIAGTCELLFLKTPAHAAVDGANRVAQSDRQAVHFKPLINAVLRRVAREGEGIIASQDAPVLNTPDWLWPRWTQNFGAETARAIANAHLAIPPLDLSYAGATPPEIPDAVQLAPGCLRLARAGRVEDIAGYSEGRWWVQDFAASLPVRLFGNINGREVIDLCAAPGGKTAQMCAAGARVTAIDLSPERLDRVQENLARLRLDAELVAADARDWRPREPAPFVLLDAPCTATGTIRRHPDLPWIKSAADIQICANLQQELLDAAAEMTAPGGILVYAGCSLEPEECEEQLQTFMRRHSDFTPDPVRAGEVFDPQFVTREGSVRTLPCYWREKGGMDGFFIIRIRRRP